MGLFGFLSGLFGEDDVDEQTRDDAGGSGGDAAADDGDAKNLTEFGPADFRQEAEEFAADHDDHEFDFSLSSLSDLDDYAASQTAVLDTPGEELGGDTGLVGGMREGYVLWWGSYFGEVLVREFDGEWMTDGEAVLVRIPTEVQPVEVLPLDAAVGAVQGEPQFAAVAADVRSDIEAADGDAVAAAPDPDEGLPTVDLDPEMDLETAHERAAAAFEDAGFQVSRGDLLNSVAGGPADDTTQLFNFYTADAMHTGVVYQGVWDEADTNGVLTLISTLRTEVETDGVHVFSAHEPPEAIAYVTGTHQCGAFALAAMGAVQNGPAFEPAAVSHYSEVGQELLATHLDVTVDVEETETLAVLETLDEVVLEQLRTVADDEQPQDGYEPQAALVLVGSVAGEVMRRAFEREFAVDAEWDDDGVSNTGVALVVGAQDSDGAVTVNPVGRVFELFGSGSGDSLAFLHRTSQKVVEDEIT